VSIRVEVGRSRDHRVSVRNWGGPIPPAEREAIFTPGFRGTFARRKRVEGQGLGLYIVRRIAEAHGGTVTLQTGTEPRLVSFVLSLPFVSVDAS
jgi:signal transduction histidine kinase